MLFPCPLDLVSFMVIKKSKLFFWLFLTSLVYYNLLWTYRNNKANKIFNSIAISGREAELKMSALDIDQKRINELYAKASEIRCSDKLSDIQSKMGAPDIKIRHVMLGILPKHRVLLEYLMHKQSELNTGQYIGIYYDMDSDIFWGVHYPVCDFTGCVRHEELLCDK